MADPASAAGQTCPPSWGPLTPAPPGSGVDANVSVFAGGNLQVSGAAAGAEGLVVALGSATFGLGAPGSYAVGTTATGSQVAPAPMDDMLLVGGDVTGAAGTTVSVGAGIGGNVALGGALGDGTALDAHGGSVDPATADAVAPYAGLGAQLAALSADYAARPATGVAVSDGTSLVLTGDGTSSVQVFTLDTTTLEALPDGGGRTLQLLDVPDGAAVLVDLVGPSVALQLDGVVAPDGAPVDPATSQYFADLSTHLLWNAPDADSVTISGAAQVPGSLLVPRSSSSTLLSASTNGRVWVGGDLAQTSGEVHSYPYLPEPVLGCVDPVVHLGALSVRVSVSDPDDVVGPRRDFGGTFACLLGGQDVTPADDTWSTRAAVDPVLLSDQLPVGAVCTLDQRLDSPPDSDHVWDDWQLKPAASLQVARRQVLGFVVANRVLDAPKPSPTASPTASPTSSPTSSPSASATATASPTDTATATTEPVPTTAPTPSSSATPVERPSATVDDSASAAPSATSRPYGGTRTRADTVASDPPLPGLKALTAHGAPLSLAGAVVWGPLLVLSLFVVLMIRVRPRPRVRRP